MKKSLLPAIAISVSAFAILLFSSSGAYGQSRPGGSRSGKSGTTNETYMVIQIGDEYKVVTTTQYKDEDKKVREENQKKVDLWKDEIKNDPKAPRPQKVVIKKLKTGYKFQEIAQEYVNKLKDEAAGNTDTAKPKNVAK